MMATRTVETGTAATMALAMRLPAAGPLALVLAALAGCNAAELPSGGIDVTHPDGDGICRQGGVQRFVGSKASDELGMEILRASGAKRLRWGGEDTAFTMDYREDRVNVIYARDGTIVKITCG